MFSGFILFLLIGYAYRRVRIYKLWTEKRLFLEVCEVYQNNLGDILLRRRYRDLFIKVYSVEHGYMPEWGHYKQSLGGGLGIQRARKDFVTLRKAYQREIETGEIANKHTILYINMFFFKQDLKAYFKLSQWNTRGIS